MVYSDRIRHFFKYRTYIRNLLRVIPFCGNIIVMKINDEDIFFDFKRVLLAMAVIIANYKFNYYRETIINKIEKYK